MDKINQKFKIIRFTPNSKTYYPASIKNENKSTESIKADIKSGFEIIKEMGIYSEDELAKHFKEIESLNISIENTEQQILHTDIEIPLGHSRYGGPVVDLPIGVAYPENLRFAAQLDLAKFSPFDNSRLLPKTGQLIFFTDIRTDIGKVIYSKVSNNELIRNVKKHEDNFYSGVLIDTIYSDTETFAERFRDFDEDEDDEDEDVNDDGKIWDDSAGEEKSKIFGIYTHCQYGQNEIEEITFSDKILLLQIGTNGFNDVGVFSVTIPKNDLKNLNFDNCEFAWGQT